MERKHARLSVAGDGGQEIHSGRSMMTYQAGLNVPMCRHAVTIATDEVVSLSSFSKHSIMQGIHAAWSRSAVPMPLLASATANHNIRRLPPAAPPTAASTAATLKALSWKGEADQ